MRTALVISPHGDDMTLHCGGTVARLARDGWRVVAVRVLDDRHESMGLDAGQTLARNAEEFRTAAAILDVAEVVDLAIDADRLAEMPEPVLRERFVRLVRTHRPHTILSLDPTDLQDDDPDRPRIARAVAAALRLSSFDKHFPQHLAEGLQPFAPAERWFFAESASGSNFVMEISETLPQKIGAVLAQETLTRHRMHRYRMQLQTAGRRVRMIDDAVAGGSLKPLVETLVGGRALAVAGAADYPEGRFAEAFRRERFGDLDLLFEQAGEAIVPGG